MGICERLYDILFDLLGIAEGSQVAMVGHFRLKAIRNGKGTPVLQKYSRKPYLVINRSSTRIPS